MSSKTSYMDGCFFTPGSVSTTAEKGVLESYFSISKQPTSRHIC
jgi:hypothetical protein